MYRRRDIQRNAAFFLGAFGVALGAIGGIMSGLGIVAWLSPSFVETAPDWFYGAVVIGLIVLMVVGWPAVDWLLNSRPTLGAPLLALLGMGLILEGLVAVFWTAWGLTGWLAIASGIILLPAASLALSGGGTEPLTWRSLRTRRVLEMEERADLAVSLIIGMVSIGFLVVVLVEGLQGGDWLTLLGLGVAGLSGPGWLAMRHFRR
ncbi:MAG: hypothetical protein AB7P40_02360 [Chloroflexota bacterium]